MLNVHVVHCFILLLFYILYKLQYLFLKSGFLSFEEIVNNLAPTGRQFSGQSDTLL